MIDTMIEQISRLHVENAELRQLLINAQFYLDLAKTERYQSDQTKYLLNVLSEDISKKLKENDGR